MKQNKFPFAELTEAEVTALLAKKHAKDIFVPQCKTGPTLGGYGAGSGPAIIDAWVMPYSWVKPIIAYEIKLSRSDYARDHKWRGYVEYCNRFYFVVPWEMISPNELLGAKAELCGLMYVTKTKRSLRIVKEAPFLRGDPPVSIFQYVLMWRLGGLQKAEGFGDDS